MAYGSEPLKAAVSPVIQSILKPKLNDELKIQKKYSMFISVY